MYVDYKTMYVNHESMHADYERCFLVMKVCADNESVC